MSQNSMESPANLTAQDFIRKDQGVNGEILEEREDREADKVAPAPERCNVRATTCTGFQIANWEKALQEKQAESNRFFNGKEISMFAPLEHFKIYGNGIFLFFSFLWRAIVFFIIMSCLALIPIIYNYNNGESYLYEQASFNNLISATSIGHFDYNQLSAESPSTADSTSIKHKILNIVVDLVNCAVFVFFIFYWEWKSQKIQEDVAKDIKLPSENTLEIVQFPQDTNQKEVKEYMSRFAPVLEVAPVKNYAQKINLSKKIFNIQMQIKEIHLCATATSLESDDQKITALQKQKQEYEEKLTLVEEIDQKKYIKFYVTFERERDRNEALKVFTKYQDKRCKLFRGEAPQQLKMNGREIVVEKCVTEPAGIIWENVHMTWKKRMIRALIQFVLILIIIAGGFFAISLLNLYAITADSNIDTTAYTWETIQTESNSTIVEAWCLQQYSIIQNTTYLSLCSGYWSEYQTDVFFAVLISIVIIGFKLVANFVVVHIAKFQRYTDHTEQSVAIMTNLLVTYLSTSVLITFLMQANVFKISFKTIILKMTTDTTLISNINSLTEYKDLTVDWYYDIGYQIWLNLLIDGFLVHCFLPLIRIPTNCIKEWLGKREKLHKNMRDAIRHPEFQIQEHYAQILMGITVGIVFGGGMAIFLPVVLVGLLTRYFFLKIDFIRFCRVPLPFGCALNDKALQVIKGAIIARGILSIYMYGAQGIFLVESAAISTWNDNYDVAILYQITEAISRFLLTWYYSLFLGILILAFIGRALIFQVIMKHCIEKLITDEVVHIDENINFFPSEGGISQRTLTKSYKIEKNPDYIEILAIMKMKQQRERKRKKARRC